MKTEEQLKCKYCKATSVIFSDYPIVVTTHSKDCKLIKKIYQEAIK